MSSEFSDGKISLIENLGIGTETVSLQVPVLSSSSFTLTFPDNIGSSNQVLKNSSTPGILEWSVIAISWKEKVSAASVGDVVLSPSPALIDDVILTTGKRVLLKDQSISNENGIYEYQSGNLVRTNDALSGSDASGSVLYVTGGSTNKDKIYYCTDGQGSLFNSSISFDELNIKKVLTGPDNSSDNAVTLFDGTSGRFIKDSDVLIDNSGNMSIQIGDIQLGTGDIILSSTLQQSITHTGGSGQNLVISSTNGLISVNDTDFKDNLFILRETNGGSERINLTAPNSITSSFILNFPENIGTANQVLSTGSTPGTMEWINQLTGFPPAGPIGSVQYNNSSVFDGSSNFSWNNGTSLLTLNGSVSGVTTLNMSDNLTNSAGDILFTSSSAQNITHTGGSGNLIINSGSNVIIDNITFNNGAISGVTILNSSDDFTNSAGDILLTSTSAQNIIHTGQSGQDLTISSGGNVIIETVVFNNGSISDVSSTLDMSSDFTNSGGDILLTSSSAQNITHTGQSGQDLTISSGGNVIIENVTMNNGALSGVNTFDMSSDFTNSGGDILLTSSSAQNITHTGQSGQDLTLSSGGNIVVDTVTFNNGAVSDVTTLNSSGDFTNSGGDILLTSTSAQNITHTGQSGQDLTISSGGNVIIENVTIDNSDLNLTDLNLTGDVTLTNLNSVFISHTGGSGDVTVSSGGNVIMEDVSFNNGSISGVTTLNSSGDFTNSSGDILLTSTSAQNITHTGQSGQDLTISSGGNVIIENVIMNNGSITATGAIRSNTSFILEDSGAGTNTVTIQAGTPGISYTLNLPPNNGTNLQLLNSDGIGGTSWENDPNNPGGLDNYIQYNESNNYTGSADLIWDDTNKQITINGKYYTNFNKTGTIGLSGSILDIKGQTFTDNTGGPTTSFAIFNSVDQPTLAATSTTTTTTASTVYIAGSPITGTNQTITDSYSLWVDSGFVKVDNNVLTDNNIECLSDILANTLTDGTVSITSGNITNVSSSTISNLTLDTLSIGSSTLSGGVLENLNAPVSTGDAVRKIYADNSVQGVVWKNIAIASSTTNVSLSGEQTIDNIILVTGDRVLLKNQTLPRQNGIWIVDTGSWSRSTDLAEGSSAAGSSLLIEKGDTYANTGFVCNSEPPNDVVGNDAGTTGNDLNFVQFTGAGILESGDGFGKSSNEFFVNVDNVTLQIVSDDINVKDNGISTSKILDNSLSTNKINDTSITNAKLNDTSVTITAGDGLQNSGVIQLGSSKSIDINSSVLRTFGDQNASGIQSFTDTTSSVSTVTGSVKVSGGMGVAGNINPDGNLNAGGIVQGSIVNQGTATLTGGNLTNINNINCSSITTSGNTEADTFLDNSTGNISSGSLTGIININSNGLITANSFIVDSSILTSGNLSNISSPTAGNDVSNKTYVDSLTVTDGDGLNKTLTIMSANIDNITIENSNDQLRIKNSSIDSTKLLDNSITSLKIQNSQVTNLKLQNNFFTFSSGIGLQGSGNINLGSSVTLNLDNTVLRNTGNQISSGIQNFTNTTQSTNSSNGSVIISGGIGVSKNVNIGENLDTNIFTSGSFINSGFNLSSGNITGAGNIFSDSITTTGTIEGNILTDGVLSLSVGDITGISSIVSSGNVSTVGSLTDSTASLSSGTLSGLSAPTIDSDVTTKLYVDSLNFGTNWIAPVRAGTTGDISLSGEQTIDTVSVITGDRVLVKNQTSGGGSKDNGIYIVDTGSWSRSSDMSTGAAEDFATFIQEGNINIGTSYIVTGDTPFLIGSSNLIWTKFASSGALNAGEALLKTGSVYDVQVDDNTIEISSNQLQIKDSGIDTAQLIDSSITTNKIGNSQISNVKLDNSSVTVTAGDGLQNGGSVSLGGSIDFDIDSTVLRISGNQTASGIQTFSDNTESGSISTGGIIVSGGLGISKNLYSSGNINVIGSITGDSSLNNSSSTLNNGNFTGIGNINSNSITATGIVQGGTLSDGTLNLSTGSFSGAVSLTVSSLITGGSLTDGTSSLSGGILSGLSSPISSTDATNKNYVDNLIVTPGSNSGLDKISTDLFILVDDSTIEINSNSLRLKDSGVTTSKLATDSVITSKINNLNVTNAKLANSSITISPGLGLQNGGSVSLGGSSTLDVDSTVFRTSGNQTASGIQTFSNTSSSTSFDTGAVVITGGLGIGGDTFTTGKIKSVDTIEGNTFSDGTMTLNSGDITGGVNINTTNIISSNTIQGGTLTDGTASLNNGSFVALINVSMTGTFTISPIPDDRVLFADNSGQFTSSSGLTWNGTSLSATEVNTQNITRPNGANLAELWTSGTGDIDIGTSATGTIQMGLGPMFKVTSTTSILQSSLTIQGNLSRQYVDTTISTASNVTYTAQEVFNGIIFRNCNGASRTDTLPTAQDIVNIVPEAIAGSSIELLISNTSTGLNLLTLQENSTPGTGTVNISETLTISPGITSRYLIVLDNIIFNQWEVSIFATVPKDRLYMQCSFTDPTQGGNSTKYAQWGPPSDATVDSTVLGFSGKIVQVVASYSNSNVIGIGAGESLSFSVGTSNATLSSFTPFTGGTNIVVWDSTFNGTRPSTSSGSLSIPFSSTDRIALRSQETGSVSPSGFEVRCTITFQLD